MKEYPPSPPEGDSATDNGFRLAQEIYAAYPRKVAQRNGMRAIERALRKYPAEFLLERTRQYAATYKGEQQFIPYPATWFNGERFNDEPAAWLHSNHRPASSRSAAPARQFNSADYDQSTESF
jgi:hypothetical protein